MQEYADTKSVPTIVNGVPATAQTPADGANTAP